MDFDFRWALIFAMGVITVQTIGRVALAFINRRRVGPALPSTVEERLARIEQAVESTAVEVERIGEGQRFVTRLLGDREAAERIGTR